MSAILKEKYLDKKYEPLSWQEVVDTPVAAISGVSEQDGVDLKAAFGIDTIRELANNRYIRIAQGVNAFSKASAEILDKAFESAEFEELRVKPVQAIAGISDDDAELLKRAFDINTIQNLAENKYVCIAQTIATLAFLEALMV
jgi:predicted RecB family nuclease